MATSHTAPSMTPPPPTTTDATGIQIRELTKTFPQTSGKPAAAVDGISLSIEPGELFFLLGPSGCGKTTLLRMIAGFIEPTSGRILFANHNTNTDVTSLPPEQRNTGMVFQSYALWPHMSVFENVAFGLDIRKISGQARKDRVIEALGAVKMEEYAERKPNQLSGGQQQRIALARAIVIRPSVLLLDEPLSNLDAKLRIELRSEIRRLCKRFGMTTVYVTHDQKEALSMADRIAILKSGKVIQVGSPTDLYRLPGSKFVAEFLGETNFIEGQIVSRETGGTGVRVQTKAGTLAAADGRGKNCGDSVTLSIRPEAFSLEPVQGASSLKGKVTDTTYLGESMQYEVQLNSGEMITMAVSNPGAKLSREVGEEIEMFVSPRDVVVI